MHVSARYGAGGIDGAGSSVLVRTLSVDELRGGQREVRVTMCTASARSSVLAIAVWFQVLGNLFVHVLIFAEYHWKTVS